MIKMPRLAAFIMLLFISIIAGLVYLPARWVIAFLPSDSPIIITTAQGSIWSARANIAIGQPGLRRSLAQPISWRFTLQNGPHIVLEHPWLQGPVNLSPSWRGLELSAQVIRMPAVVLNTVHTAFIGLQPEGDILLRWPDLLLKDQGPVLVSSQSKPVPVLTMQWLNASLALSQNQFLGNYSLKLEQQQNDYAINLVTDSGPLMISGTGAIDFITGNFRFDGKAKIDPAASQSTKIAVQPILSAISPYVDGNGDTIIRINI